MNNPLFILCPLLFISGFIDSIAGGGGLIALTAYIAVGIPNLTALGTNKFSSACGTTVAVIRYSLKKQVLWTTAICAAIGAFGGSKLGSEVARHMDDRVFQYLMLILVPAVSVLTVLKKDFGDGNQESVKGTKALVLSLFIGLVVGFYDGFFGPGAGMFLTLAFTAILKLDLSHASGNSRVVNLASNLAALVTWIPSGNVDYSIAIPCALCGIAGSYLGSGLAIKNGARIIRPIK
ncbi:MAG: TSUP family transporter, partial [Sphaerochaetaceae bacterium]|nr:TSUP family transporter [Sphaerochaetaceae bacterium]